MIQMGVGLSAKLMKLGKDEELKQRHVCGSSRSERREY